MIQIKFKDIDPDSGRISQEKVIATCETNEQAKWIIEALYKHSEEPNRDFFREVVDNVSTVIEAKEQKKSVKKKELDAEALRKAQEIDDEIRRVADEAAQQQAKMTDAERSRIAMQEYNARYAEEKRLSEQKNKNEKKRPSNNGYVPYDQFKF